MIYIKKILKLIYLWYKHLSMRQAISSKEFIIVILLLVTKLIIHLSTNTNYEVHRDALLYYSLGEHLSWGFASVPPLIAVIGKVSVGLFGNTAFALRFFPMIIGLLSIFIISDIIIQLGGRWKAILIAGLAFILSPAFLRSNTLFQPVSFNQFFWLFTMYLVIKMINKKKPQMWLWIFLVLGIAFLNKYSIVFFSFGLMLALLLSQHRWLIFSKYFLIGIFVAFLVVSPNLYWQFSHNWPVLHHMAELHKYQLVNVSYIGFLIDQFLMNFPGIVVWLTGLFVFLFAYKEKKFRFIVSVYLITLIILLINKGKSYYTLGLYPILFALGGFAIEKYWHKWGISILSIFIILTGILMAPISLPVFSFEKMAQFTKPMAQFTNRWEDGKTYAIPQDYADMTGWNQLAILADSCFNSLPVYKQNNTQIFAENYGAAGALYFYNNQSKVKPISFSDSFVLWAPETFDSNALMMIDSDLDEGLCQYFDTCYIMAKVNDKYFRENGIRIMMYDGANQQFKDFYKEQLNLRIKNYKRNNKHD